jgi:anti-sigma B factor antagonist
MKADVRKAGDVIIVDLQGDLVLGDGDEVLQDVFSELLTEGWKKILLNLSKVSRLDSSGIGELVRGWKTATKLGASVKLLRLGDRVKHTLHLSQVLPLLEVFEEEKAALASFQPTQ